MNERHILIEAARRRKALLISLEMDSPLESDVINHLDHFISAMEEGVAYSRINSEVECNGYKLMCLTLPFTNGERIETNYETHHAEMEVLTHFHNLLLSVGATSFKPGDLEHYFKNPVIFCNALTDRFLNVQKGNVYLVDKFKGFRFFNNYAIVFEYDDVFENLKSNFDDSVRIALNLASRVPKHKLTIYNVGDLMAKQTLTAIHV